VVTAAGFGTVASDAGPAGGPPLAEQDRILQQLLAADLWTVILLSIGFGLLVAFTACMYPMIPILSSIIVGQGENTTVARSFGLSLIYVQAMALTFGVVGAIMAMLGETVGIQAYFQSPWLLIPFALLFVLLALAMFGFYDIQVPSFIQSRLTAFSSKQRGGTLLGVGAMGVLSALIIGPCGGPVLVAELAYATATADPVKGFIALFAFGNGMGLPLLVVGATGGKLLPKAGVWMDAVKATAGVILLAVAIVMLERLPSIIPPSVTMLMWAALFIVTAIYLGVLEPITQGASGWRKLWKGLGAVFLIYGSIVLVGGITGGVSVTDPLHGSALTAAPTASGGGAASTQNSFRTVKTVEDLERELAAASASGQTVLLDFYADWCTYCKVLERYVFPDPGVQAALADTLLLKADVTRMDAEDTRLMSSLNVKLPPTLVLYDGNGEELRNYRIVGELKVDEFERHVRAAFGS
jgi:thiol:disulfide interchange protein DsbD